ncbi:MAG TPA: PCMD domain-containing protein [Candidatus Barnesiella merdipullorum]|nr:PCMD domain-containing protein [Candidatus Barnesiella merdipullorum]
MKYDIKKYLACALLLMVLFTACKEEEMALGEGAVRLSVNVSGDVSVVTRAVDPGISASMQTRIYSSKGLIRYYDATTPMPETLNLASGQYHAFVLAGDSVPAAFNTPYYTGSTDFTVRSGETTSASVTCTIANTLATVAFDPALDEVVTDCKVKIFTTTGELYFTEATTDSVGYYMFSGKERNLAWTFEGKKTDGNSYTQSGVVEHVNPATKYAFTFNFDPDGAATGGTFLDVKVNEATIDSTHNVVITLRPQIVGDKFDLNEPLYYETNGGSETSLWVNAATKLQRVWLSCDKLTDLGFPTDSIDFLAANGSLAADFQSRGISCKHTYQEDKDLSNAKITLSESFVQSLPGDEYTFTINAIDAAGKDNTATLSLVVSDAIVVTEEAERSSIWARRATLLGSVVKETSEPLSFQFREAGTDSWTSVPASRSGMTLSAQLTDLTPGTTYEYQAMAGTQASVKTATFTTEAATALPNSSFENWQTLSSSAMVMYGPGEEMFWDSGNHGSATLNKNVTSPDETYKHSGRYSVKLQSQFVGVLSFGKFAAGNLFAGQYLRTDGTDGVLSFGRPFTSRPSKLKGYIKYTPGTVDYSSTSDLPTGATDIGNIYIAIGDWSEPIEIRTKDKKLFDKNDEKIIAYGEKELTSITQGADGGLLEFEIPLDYRSLDRIPSYIVIVASASKYGDYFTGSTGSTMWIDDLELIYE